MDNYKEKYERALKRAKAMISVADNQEEAYNCAVTIFPELKESEDEKIRKFLIKWIQDNYYHGTTEIPTKTLIAWLEKQGNSTDKVEPKFKVGDWIVQENIGIYKVVEVCESWYEVIDNQNNHYSIGFDKEDMCHLWTIRDAKDGDVLCDCHEAYDNPLIFILKKFEHINFGLVRPSDYSSYCFLTAGDEQKFKEGTYHHKHNIKPATKEQSDLLFQRMKEAGYEWDPEKKVIRNLLGGVKRMKKIEQKSAAWSEEDEKIFVNLISYGSLKYTGEQVIDWLKSLKQRIGG